MSEEQMKRYLDMRSVYYAQLVNIHKREVASFKQWQMNRKK